MSAKLLHALTDDNPDLQKQIGCMTGIFQLFDRNHIITAKRIASHQTPRKITAGPTRSSNGNLGGESHNARNIHIDKERNLGKNANENQRVSTESSRASFSSSCSSSFSSVECNKPAQPELLSFDRTISREVTLKESHAYQSNASAQLGRQSPDFRDVVKDSMYRELSVKTSAKEEQASRIMKHRDSPRPMQMPKSVNESLELGINTRQNLKDSLKVLAKLREAPRYFNDPRGSPTSSYETRDGTLLSLPKDAPRFSYDGREIPRSSFESRDNFKSTTRLRDLPRLSLDSRASSIKDSNLNAKSNFMKDYHGSRDDFTRTLSKQQELQDHKRNPSVVAKLMGLEAMPNSIIANEGPMGSSKIHLSEKTDEQIQSATASSPRQSIKETASPRLRKPEPVVKPIPSSRVPIEPAPWRQLGSSHGFQKPTSRSSDFSPRAMSASPSVYAEIEKRLKDLEFKQADKDLRALKQILDAMQAKVLLESKKEDDKAFLSEENSEDHNPTTVDRNSRLSNRQSPSHTSSISPNLKRTGVPKTFDSPIVIMKPAKLVEKSGIPASSVICIEDLSGLRKLRNVDIVNSKRVYANNHTATDVTTRLGLGVPSSGSPGSTINKGNSRTLKSTQTSNRSSQLPRQNTGSSGRGTTGSMNSRQQQKKLEVEKRTKPPLHSLELSKPRRQSTKQPAESGSPGGKRRPKSSNLQQSDDQLSEISSETRNSSHLGDEISPQLDVEIISTDGSADMSCAFSQQGGRSPSRNFTGSSTSSSTQKKMSAMQNEDGSETESTSVAPEQPSPVSVLDASFYKDDLPSPDGKEAFKVETQKSNEPSAAVGLGWDAVDINHPCGVAGPNHSIEISRKKLENVGNLVQKLQRLNSNHDEDTTDYIASLCENTNPDYRYISEILLASGLLLRDLGSGLTSIQLHASGHPINPDLFFVLEQTKVKTALSSRDKQSHNNVVWLKFDQEKVHRKLVFDAVNEILERKFASMALPSELWLRTDKLAGRASNAQQLLRELCSEIEKLQVCETSDGCSVDGESLNTIVFKDVVCESDKWTGFPKEISGIVLDVERSIFKELVDEVVSGEAMSFRAKPRRRSRQLFTK